MTKTKQEKILTHRIGLVYIENDTKPLGPIKSGMIYDKTKQDNDMTDLTGVVYAKKENEIL